MNHSLKTWPGPFNAVALGRKRYEVRRNDRGFQVGDVLELMEFEPDRACFTGRHLTAVVEYMTEGGEWRLPEDVCVLGIRVVCVQLQGPRA